MSQGIDYDAVIADIESKIASLQETVKNLKIAKALDVGGFAKATITPEAQPREVVYEEEDGIGPGTFHGLSISKAAIKFFKIVRKKKKTQEICDALRDGGIESASKNFYSNVYTGLKRDKHFVNLGNGYWALTEWHPNRAAPPAPAKKTSKKKSKRKAAKKKVTVRLKRAPKSSKDHLGNVVDLASRSE